MQTDDSMLPVSIMLSPVRLPTTSALIVFGRPAFATVMPVSSAPLPLKYAAVALPVAVKPAVDRRPSVSRQK